MPLLFFICIYVHRFIVKTQDKNNFNSPTVSFPFLSSNIPSILAFGVYTAIDVHSSVPTITVIDTYNYVQFELYSSPIYPAGYYGCECSNVFKLKAEIYETYHRNSIFTLFMWIWVPVLQVTPPGHAMTWSEIDNVHIASRPGYKYTFYKILPDCWGWSTTKTSSKLERLFRYHVWKSNIQLSSSDY